MFAQVLKGTYPAIPSSFSRDLVDLVRECLDQAPERRPTVSKILASPAVTSRMHLVNGGVSGAGLLRGRSAGWPCLLPARCC